MKLTKTQKEALLEKYISYVKHKVSNYYHTIQPPFSGCWEDFFQEASIAFCKHLDRIESEREVFRAYIHMFHAMNRFKESLNVLSVPHDVYAEHGGCSRLPFHDWDGVENSLSMEEQIDFQTFYEHLSDTDRQLWDLREAGYKNREIAAKLGLSDAWATRRLRIIRKKLAEHLRCDDD